jgi:hypothetical protein
VTDQRVLIVSSLWGRRVVSLIRTRLPAINLVSHANGRGTISFGTDTRGRPAAPAFEMIAEPIIVMELLLPSSATGYRTDPVPPLSAAQTAPIARNPPSIAERIRVIAPFLGVALFAGFFLTKLFYKPETVGEATLHLYFESREQIRLPLPAGWRGQHGHDRHDQCALLLDAESRPRFFVCAFGYLGDRGPTRLEDLTALVLRNAHTPGAAGTVESETHQTPRGAINTVTKTHSSSARFFGVVKSERAVDVTHLFMLDGILIELRFTEDAANRGTLDPIAWQLTQSAQLVK